MQKGRGGTHSREACVHDSHREGSQIQTQEMDQSGGVAQGCHWSTGAETGGQCDHTSNRPFGLAVPSSHPSIQVAREELLLSSSAKVYVVLISAA
ncbi:hypothetical protein Tco_0667965 [Tanacetum coccineum]